MEEARVTSSLWAVAADVLGCNLQTLLLIQNLLIQVGRVTPGLLVEEEEEMNCCRFPGVQWFFYQSLAGTGGHSVALWQRGLCWAGGILRGETPLGS